MKTCSKCGVEKDPGGFYKDSGFRDGLSRSCRACAARARRETAEKNLAGGMADGRTCSRCKEWKPAAAFNLNLSARGGLNHRCKACESAGYSENKKKALARSARYKRARYGADAGFRLRSRLGSALSVFVGRRLRGIPVSGKWLKKAAGVDGDVVVEKLRKELLPGMSPENYGSEWEIDHVVPVSSFDHSDPAAVVACWSPKNLRPLFKRDNSKKGPRRAPSPAARVRVSPESPWPSNQNAPCFLPRKEAAAKKDPRGRDSA